MIKYVVLIGATYVDWKGYLRLSESVLGRRITQKFDELGLDPKNLGGFLATIGEMLSPGSDPLITLRNGGSILDHSHVIMAIVADKDSTLRLMQETRLVFSTAESIEAGWLYSILSGTVTMWRDAIINCSTPRVTQETRAFANEVLVLLDRAGIGEVFNNYAKTKHDEFTFNLTPK